MRAEHEHDLTLHDSPLLNVGDVDSKETPLAIRKVEDFSEVIESAALDQFNAALATQGLTDGRSATIAAVNAAKSLVVETFLPDDVVPESLRSFRRWIDDPGGLASSHPPEYLALANAMYAFGMEAVARKPCEDERLNIIFTIADALIDGNIELGYKRKEDLWEFDGRYQSPTLLSRQLFGERHLFRADQEVHHNARPAYWESLNQSVQIFADRAELSAYFRKLDVIRQSGELGGHHGIQYERDLISTFIRYWQDIGENDEQRELVELARDLIVSYLRYGKLETEADLYLDHVIKGESKLVLYPDNIWHDTLAELLYPIWEAKEFSIISQNMVKAREWMEPINTRVAAGLSGEAEKRFWSVMNQPLRVVASTNALTPQQQLDMEGFDLLGNMMKLSKGLVRGYGWGGVCIGIPPEMTKRMVGETLPQMIMHELQYRILAATPYVNYHVSDKNGLIEGIMHNLAHITIHSVFEDQRSLSWNGVDFSHTPRTDTTVIRANPALLTSRATNTLESMRDKGAEDILLQIGARILFDNDGKPVYPQHRDLRIRIGDNGVVKVNTLLSQDKAFITLLYAGVVAFFQTIWEEGDKLELPIEESLISIPEGWDENGKEPPMFRLFHLLSEKYGLVVTYPNKDQIEYWLEFEQTMYDAGGSGNV